MTKEYNTPELELIWYHPNESIFTSEPGPPDLDNGEDFDPDSNNGNGINGYFTD